MSLASIMEGIGTVLDTIPSLRVYDFPAAKVEPPAVILSLPETPYDVTMGSGADEWTFPIWLLVSRADDRASYAEMIPYIDSAGAKSIFAVLESNRTLGGNCDTLAVLNARPQFATVGGIEFLAVQFTLEVYG